MDQRGGDTEPWWGAGTSIEGLLMLEAFCGIYASSNQRQGGRLALRAGQVVVEDLCIIRWRNLAA